MLNIIETPRNYFTRGLLHGNLSSDVALHFNVICWRPYSVASCSEEVFCWTVQPLWVPCWIVRRSRHQLSDTVMHDTTGAVEACWRHNSRMSKQNVESPQLSLM